MPPPSRNPSVLDLQVARSIPVPDGLEQGQGLILPADILARKLAHFAEEVYDTSPESVLGRWMKILLGDAGVGWTRKRVFMRRLQESLSGTNFFDIDRFYGALFAVGRRSSETPDFDPYTELATYDEWETILSYDSAYRSRVEQFAAALHLGATPGGIEALSEALLAVDVDVYEGYIRADNILRTYGDLEVAYATYGDMDTVLYDVLEGGDGSAGSQDRYHFTVAPKRAISIEEQYDLVRAIMRFKPAWSTFDVLASGPETFINVGISSAEADSEYWEVRRQVLPLENVAAAYALEASVLAEPPRPPFLEYQGEAWSYLSDSIGVSSYRLTNLGPIPPENTTTQFDLMTRMVVEQTGVSERIVFPDGVLVQFGEDRAVQSQADIIAGRASSDAVMVSSPVGIRRGVGAGNIENPTISSLPSLYVDRADISSLIVNRPTNVGSLSQDYWSTPPLPGTDTTPVAIEVRFHDSKLVNYCTFEAPRFPHVGLVQFFSNETSRWETIHSYVMRESFPERFSKLVTEGHRHPQHDFNGHWQKVTMRLPQPVSGPRYRVLLQRGTYGAFPVDTLGEPAAYSLGIRNLDLGYRIASIDDIPNLMVQPGQGWANTQDTLGSRVYFDTRSRPASNVLSSTSEGWWSEPQPFPNCVVNLYLDMRSADNDGQVVDRFWIEPLTESVPFNLYWSDGTVDAQSFKASVQPIPFNSALMGGEMTESGLVEEMGESLVVYNSAVQFDPRLSWWCGVCMTTSVDSSSPTAFMNFSPAWDYLQRYLIVKVDNDQLVVDYVGFDDAWTNTLDVSFNAGDRVSVVVSYNSATHVLDVHFKRESDDVIATSFDINPMMNENSNLSFGDFLAENGMTIHSITIKQHVTMEPYGDDAERFFLSPMDYPVPDLWAHSDDHHTDNSIFRFHPSFVTEANFRGIVGGAGRIAEHQVWNLVPRSYRLQKGFIHLPPVKAKFFKLEFTSLFPKWYEPFIPIVRRVRTFPRGLVRSTRQSDTASSAYDGLTTLQDTPPEFIDRPGDTTLSVTGMPSPTAALHAPDPMAARNLAGLSWQYRFADWRPDFEHPAWWGNSIHQYQELEILHDQKVSFGVGIKQLSAHRLDFGAADDTRSYRDLLHDLLHVDQESPFSFSFSPGYLHSTINTSVAQSTPMGSRHSVHALQFATQQTPAVQILPNDDFRDPATARDAAPRHATYDNDGSEHIVVVWDVVEAEVLASLARGSTILRGEPTAATANTLTDSTQAWNPSGWIGKKVRIYAGLGAGQERDISANTATQLTVSVNWTTNPDSTSQYAIEDQSYTATDNTDHWTVTWPIGTADTYPWGFLYDIRRPTDSWHSYGDADMSYLAGENMVLLTRNVALASNFRPGGSGSVRPMGDPVMSYRDGGIGPRDIQVGGIESPFVVSSPKGTIAAAARITAPADLSSPLKLQIVASDDITVLAEKSITVKAGSIIEESVQYHIGSDYSDGSLADFPRRFINDPVNPVFAGLDPLVDGAGNVGHLFRVRLVQEGAQSSDEWLVDRLSLFDESIIWEFSNNGGATFHQVIGEIRNNPNGLHTFPTAGNSLVWRATSYRKNMAISSIQIRPWYEGSLSIRSVIPQRAGNVSTFDQDPPVDEDPEFQRWHKIVPRNWYLQGRRFPVNEMALDDFPTTTEYARTFVTNIDEELDAISDDAARTNIVVRDLDETAPVSADGAARSQTLGRSLEEDAPSTDSLGFEALGGDWEFT